MDDRTERIPLTRLTGLSEHTGHAMECSPPPISDLSLPQNKPCLRSARGQSIGPRHDHGGQPQTRPAVMAGKSIVRLQYRTQEAVLP